MDKIDEKQKVLDIAFHLAAVNTQHMDPLFTPLSGQARTLLRQEFDKLLKSGQEDKDIST